MVSDMYIYNKAPWDVEVWTPGNYLIPNRSDRDPCLDLKSSEDYKGFTKSADPNSPNVIRSSLQLVILWLGKLKWYGIWESNVQWTCRILRTLKLYPPTTFLKSWTCLWLAHGALFKPGCGPQVLWSCLICGWDTE